MGDGKTLLEHYEKIEADISQYPIHKAEKVLESISDLDVYRSFRPSPAVRRAYFIFTRIVSCNPSEIMAACNLYGVKLYAQEVDLIYTLSAAKYEQYSNGSKDRG